MRTAVPRGTAARVLRARCSCDLIVRLADRPPVRDALARFSVTAGTLAAGQDGLHRECAPETADWHVRLAQRGGDGAGAGSDLAMLLAIVRSADTHAYQLLERSGTACAAVRRAVIEELRSLGTSRLQPTGNAPPPGRARHISALPSRSPRPLRGSAEGPNDDAPLAAPVGRTMARTTAREPRPTLSRRTCAAAEPATADVARAQADAVVDAQPGDDSHAHPASAHTLTAIVAKSLPTLAGRHAELRRLADALGRSGARAPLLVGAPGSGRTLLGCHLASLLSRPVFRLEATRYQDDDELRRDLEAIEKADGVAIVDDLDRVVAEVAPVCLPALTHAWSVGRPPVLTIVSPQGRARLSAWLPGGVDTLDVVEIDPLSGDALLQAVAGSAPGILAAHGLSLASDAKLGELTRLAERFLGFIAMPARALDLLDLACARTVREGGETVTRESLIEIVVERSGLPRARIEGDDDHRLLELETRLGRRVVGHAEAIGRLADLVRRNQAGFGSQRPIASVLLLGPSGVGKTEIAKSLAEALFDRADALVRLDMSEYTESHAVARVVGAPPGYVGFEQGGALVDPLCARPHRVVLLDEIEKAHRDVHQLLLQVFDEGRLTDGRGRTIDFRHAVVIMTSNLGADLLANGQGAAAVLARAREAFPIELWNRIEAPLVLSPLSGKELERVCRRLAKDSSARLLKERGIQYSLSEAACTMLVLRAGRDPSLGARPLRHLLTREVESMLADAVLRGRLRAGTTVSVDVRGGRLVVDP